MLYGTAEGDLPLTAEGLLRRFGSRTPIAREGVRVLHDSLESAASEPLSIWRGLFGKWAGRAMDRVPKHLAKLARRYGVSTASDNADTLLFALQTYYAMLVNLVAYRILGDNGADLLPGNPFSWYLDAPSARVRCLTARLTEAMQTSEPVPLSSDDLFKPLYQDLLPRPLRHALGEYYTPDWLAAHVLDQVGYTGGPGARLLDPACGSGTFLVMALWRMRGGRRGTGNEWRGPGEEWRGPGEKIDLPSPFGRGAGGEGSVNNQSQAALTLALSQKERGPKSSPAPRPPSPAPSFPVVGFDINPLAVLTARANYLIAVADLLPRGCRVEAPVYLCDSILGVPAPPCGEAQFDYVVGNPPWIAWDNLPEQDRQATKPLWERYGLFSLGGNEARHGGGKKDLSMLMLYAAADRYLKPEGRLGMVVTQTLFQSKGAGDGFRRFRLGPDGPPLGVLRVDDLTALRPFGDASNWTSTIVLRKGTATEYPVPYVKWVEGRGKAESGKRKAEEVASDRGTMAGDIHHSSFINHHFCLARPIDPARPNSPWLVRPEGADNGTSLAIGPADYRAHLGANSGGANGVYWVEVLGGGRGTGGEGRGNDECGMMNDECPAGNPAGRGGSTVHHAPFPVPKHIWIRNVAARGKRRVETVEQVIEPDLLYPLLRWSDVRRWSAMPSGYILLAQEPATRAGIDESVMRERYPRTLEYLERFHHLLSSRAAYRRYQPFGPFYAMYNVGPYTTAPIKVVWRRMDRRINAAVVEEVDDPLLGRRPVIPQETCALVACESSDEAHYICAMLNSDEVNELVTAHSVRGGKGFGTPSMLDFVPLHRFDPSDPRHVELAARSRQAAAAARR